MSRSIRRAPTSTRSRKACDAGKTTRFDAAGAILLASENAVKVANEAVQALGGAGYTKDWPVERYLSRRQAARHRRGHQRDPPHADRARADRRLARTGRTAPQRDHRDAGDAARSHSPRGSDFLDRDEQRSSAAIQARFITPPTNSSAISSQQQPTQIQRRGAGRGAARRAAPGRQWRAKKCAGERHWLQAGALERGQLVEPGRRATAPPPAIGWRAGSSSSTSPRASRRAARAPRATKSRPSERDSRRGTGRRSARRRRCARRPGRRAGSRARRRAASSPPSSRTTSSDDARQRRRHRHRPRREPCPRRQAWPAPAASATTSAGDAAIRSRDASARRRSLRQARTTPWLSRWRCANWP